MTCTRNASHILGVLHENWRFPNEAKYVRLRTSRRWHTLVCAADSRRTPKLSSLIFVATVRPAHNRTVCQRSTSYSFPQNVRIIPNRRAGIQARPDTIFCCDAGSPSMAIAKGCQMPGSGGAKTQTTIAQGLSVKHRHDRPSLHPK